MQPAIVLHVQVYRIPTFLSGTVGKVFYQIFIGSTKQVRELEIVVLPRPAYWCWSDLSGQSSVGLGFLVLPTTLLKSMLFNTPVKMSEFCSSTSANALFSAAPTLLLMSFLKPDEIFFHFCLYRWLWFLSSYHSHLCLMGNKKASL